MKKTYTKLEFFKGDLIALENHVIQLEKHYLSSNKEIINSKGYLNTLLKFPLLEYRKIQIKNLIHTLNRIESIHNKNYFNIQKVFRQIQRLKDTTILDAFSQSVQTHIIKKLKKSYHLKPKFDKNKPYYIIFSLKGTNYCIYGKIKQIFSFTSLENLNKFIEKNVSIDNVIFPNIKTLKNFIPKNIKKIYLTKIYKEKHQKYYYIIFYHKLLCKEKIENLKLYPINTLYKNDLIPYYFLYKGKKIYYLE